jgi:hypothetical protein
MPVTQRDSAMVIFVHNRVDPGVPRGDSIPDVRHHGGHQDVTCPLPSGESPSLPFQRYRGNLKLGSLELSAVRRP